MTKLSNVGFPINSLPKYLNLFKRLPYNFEIVNLEDNICQTPNRYTYFQNIKQITDGLAKIDINSLSISQAYDVLYTTQNKLKMLNKEFPNEAKE